MKNASSISRPFAAFISALVILYCGSGALTPVLAQTKAPAMAEVAKPVAVGAYEKVRGAGRVDGVRVGLPAVPCPHGAWAGRFPGHQARLISTSMLPRVAFE